MTSASIFGHGSLSGALSKSDSPRSMGGVPDHVDSTSEVEAKATLSRKVDSGVSSSSSSSTLLQMSFVGLGMPIVVLNDRRLRGYSMWWRTLFDDARVHSILVVA